MNIAIPMIRSIILISLRRDIFRYMDNVIKTTANIMSRSLELVNEEDMDKRTRIINRVVGCIFIDLGGSLNNRLKTSPRE